MNIFIGWLGVLVLWSGIGLHFFVHKLCHECNEHQLWRNHKTGVYTKMEKYLAYADRVALVASVSGTAVIFFALIGG